MFVDYPSKKSIDYWKFWARDATRAGSEFYARLAEGIGEDPDLRAMTANTKPGQPPPNLILAAAHFLLLRGAQHPLRNFYADLNEGHAAQGDAFPAFRDFCFAHRDEMERLIASRITNTNEVGRSAILHAGFRAVAAEAGEPLNLIEIGPSAGLNLIWDRYGVSYRSEVGAVVSVQSDAPLVIDCEWRGENRPPDRRTPRVGRRLGLELNPVDLNDRDDRDWLRALIWPDQVARLERLDRAIALFGKDPPEIRAGDALELLPDAIADMPRNETVCIYHTITVYQFSRQMREKLEDILMAASRARPVHRLSFEYNGKDNALTLITYGQGSRSERLLALGHPHGAWLEWRA